MKTIKTIILPLLILWGTAAFAQIGIGQWRDHLCYSSLHELAFAFEEGNIYGAGKMGAFSYNLSQSTISRLSKPQGLSDAGIKTIAYDPLTHTLVIAYTNSNIDLVQDEKTYNISDIKRSSIGGDKGINHIRFFGRRAYLACGFGIVVVDLVRHEIEETYYIGDGGSYIAVNDIAFTDSLIFAATSAGLRYARKDNRHLNIATNWTPDTITTIRDMSISTLQSMGDTLYSTLDFYGDGTTCLFGHSATNGLLSPINNGLGPLLSGNIRTLRMANGRMAVNYFDSVVVYSANHNRLWCAQDIDWMDMEANDALCDRDGNLWIAHNWGGLIKISPANTILDVAHPQSPASDNVYRLKSYKNRMMVAPGGKSTTFTNAYLAPNVYTFKKEEWASMDRNGHNDNLFDIVDVAVNPKNDKQVLAAAWGYGIIELTENKITNIFNSSNTNNAISDYTSEGYTSTRTGAVAFDSKGNAWMTNSLADNGLVVRLKDGSWKSFNTQSLVQGEEIDKIICDSVRDYKWFCGRANKIFLHDGEGKMAYVDPNNGSKMETSSVNCIVQDHDGDIWIGTNKGLKVLGSYGKAFPGGGHGEKSGITCMNITISNGEFAEYLMAYENITSIAVDGANCKWVGTASGGLYLISENGQKELQHFTASNSKLFSDKIVTLSILPTTGEVFIGTDKGLQSYRGTATFANHYPADSVHVFPNPVRPDYDGPIAINGFSRNALIHITNIAGHIVFSGTATGGQVIWNGRTNNGEKVASGTYFVFASDEEGQMRTVAKILIVR